MTGSQHHCVTVLNIYLLVLLHDLHHYRKILHVKPIFSLYKVGKISNVSLFSFRHITVKNRGFLVKNRHFQPGGKFTGSNSPLTGVTVMHFIHFLSLN